MSADGLLATLGIWFLIAQVIGLVSLVFWILQLIRLFKRKDKTAAISILVVGIILILIALIPLFWLIPLLWIPTVIALFLGRSPEEEVIEKEADFWCGICNIKYQRDFLGGETAYEGKICRSCLGKKHRGETPTPPPNPTPSQPYEPYYHEPRSRFKEKEVSSREKRILLRELSRKQSKKNSYLTQFIINLVVLQWLIPLITYLFYWMQLKEKMKVQALNNPGAGLTTEIPFRKVIKDFFKILTSETYNYGGHKIVISLTWKIGIGAAFLLPLIIWIYYLVRFFGAKGEVERLETEIKTL